MDQCREASLLRLSRFGCEGCEPSLNCLASAHRAAFHLAAERSLVFCLLVNHLRATQPHFPRLNSTGRNADSDAFLPRSASGTCGDTKGLKPPLKTNRISIDHHQKAHRFLVILADVASKTFNTLQHEASSAVGLPGLYIDSAKMALQNRSEQPFLFNVLTEQQTSQSLQHPTGLPGRPTRKALTEIRRPPRTALRSQVRRIARIARENPEPGSP